MTHQEAIPRPPTPDPGGLVEVVRAALAHLGEPGVLERVGDEDLLALAAVWEQAGRAVDAGRDLIAGALEHRSRPGLGGDRLCVRKGFARAEDLVSETTGTSRREAASRITRAGALQPQVLVSGELAPSRFPVLRAAVVAGLVSGEVSGLVARSLTQALDHGARPERVGQGERALVAAAVGADAVRAHLGSFPGASADSLLREARRLAPGRGRPVAQLTRLAASWARALTQEADRARQKEAGERREAERAAVHGRRFLRVLPTRDGTRRLEGELLPEVAAQLELILDAYLSPRTDDARHGIAAPPGEDADGRSPGQRRHDAFAGILSVAARVPEMPRIGGAGPTLLVTTTVEDLGDPDGVAFLAGTHDEVGSEVDIRVAHHAGCVGEVQRLVMSPSGRVLDLSTSQRIFTPHQRTALIARDGGCTIPGCEVPAVWCEAHHVTEWSAGGATTTDNGCLVCW